MGDDETALWAVTSVTIVLTLLGCYMTLRHFLTKEKKLENLNFVLVVVIFLAVDVTLLSYLISTRFRISNGGCLIPKPGQKFCYTDQQCPYPETNTVGGDNSTKISIKNQKGLQFTENLNFSGTSSSNEIITIEYPSDGNVVNSYKMFFNYDTDLPVGGVSMDGVYGLSMGYFYRNDDGVSVYIRSDLLSTDEGKVQIIDVIQTGLGSCSSGPGTSIPDTLGNPSDKFYIRNGETLSLAVSNPLNMTETSLNNLGVSSNKTKTENSIFNNFKSVDKVFYIQKKNETKSFYKPYDIFLKRKQELLKKINPYLENRKYYTEGNNSDNLSCLDPGIVYPLCSKSDYIENENGGYYQSGGVSFPSCTPDVIPENGTNTTIDNSRTFEGMTKNVISDKGGYDREASWKNLSVAYDVFDGGNCKVVGSENNPNNNCNVGVNGLNGASGINAGYDKISFPSTNVFCWRGVGVTGGQPLNNKMGSNREDDIRAKIPNYKRQGDEFILGFE